MRTRAFAFVLASVVAGTSLSVHLPRVFAQGMDADTKEAKLLFEDGVKLYKGGKYEEARVKFKAAYGLKRRPSIVLNLANAELQTKRPLEAIGHYKELISMADAKADDKAEAQTGLGDAKKQVALIMVDAPTGTMVVLDGENRPLPVDGEIYVMPGAHTVVVKVSKEIVEKVTLTAGQTHTVKPKAETTPPPVVVPPPVATTPPPVATSETPPVATEAPPAASSEAPPPPPPPSDTAKRGALEGVHPVTYVAAGVAVLATIGWVAFSINAKTHDDNATKLAEAFHRPTCGAGVTVPCTTAQHKVEFAQQGRDEIASADSARTLSLVCGIGAGVGVATAVVTYFVLRKPAESKVTFVTAPTYGGATFHLVGVF